MALAREIELHLRRMNSHVVAPDDWERRFHVFPPAWVIVPLIALMFPLLPIDGLIEQSLGGYPNWVKHESPFWFIAKQAGEYWVTGLAVLLLGLLHPWRWRAALLPVLASIVMGLLAGIFKWVVGRERPVTTSEPFDFHIFRGGLPGLFHETNLCFPSGHATLAFSTATILTLLVPRAWWVWFGIAALCALQRVLELAHYPTDALGGAIIGILGARWTVHLCLVFAGKR